MTNKKTKIGLITMSNIYNYGSALQTYATIKSLEKLGFTVEVIDYDFPLRFRYGLKTSLKNILKYPLGLSDAIKPKKFHNFWSAHYPLSKHFTREGLITNPPSYDIYMTGSDQVWNPNHGDTTFLLDFIKDPNVKRISYASSIGTNTLPNNYAELFRQGISKYSHIGVREESDITTVMKYSGREAKWVCDPSILLDKEEWLRLIDNNKSAIGNKINREYILAYILDYAYNPYPFAYKLIERVSSTLKIPVIFLDARLKQKFKLGYKCINNCGPIDFLSLIANASFIVTTSFHGTAFASNLGIPFCSLIKSHNFADTRMLSFLNKIGAQSQIVECNNMPNFDFISRFDKEAIESGVSAFRNESMSFLRNSLL